MTQGASECGNPSLQRLPSGQPVAIYSWNLLGAVMFRQFSLVCFLKMFASIFNDYSYRAIYSLILFCIS